jgi:hypothetical protein
MNLSEIPSHELYQELKKRNMIIGHAFTREDVATYARDSGYKPTDDDVDEICDRIDQYFDANQGVNWSVIDYHIEYYFNVGFKEEEEEFED